MFTVRNSLSTIHMNLLVLSTSLNPNSRSRILADAAVHALTERGANVDFIDLRELTLPICDGNECYADPTVVSVGERIRRAAGILVAVPIYNYDVGAASKNLVELSGDAWEGKTVGFLCAAGGQGSYMSVMAFAASLMLDFRCLIVPRFVYATKSAFQGNTLADQKTAARVDELTRELVRIVGALY